jgi:hypothetical protein
MLIGLAIVFIGMMYVLIVGLAVLGCAGWVLNLIQVVHIKVFTFLAAVKIIGIIIGPVGAILGWLNFNNPMGLY